MHAAIDLLLTQIRPKVTAILRTRAYYSVPELLPQFKIHIWELMEANMGGIFHAATLPPSKNRPHTGPISS